jgi:hypothetical protein
MATFTDNFNRADETPLGSPYTSVVGAGLILSSNSVKSVDGGSYYIDALIGEDYDDDQYAEVELGTLGIFDSAGVGVRFNSGGSGYAVRFEPAGPDLYLDSFSSASQSELTVLENVTYLTGDTIGLGVVGNVLTIYRNGISVGTFTDASSNHTSGVPALSYRRNNNGSTTIDNFSAEGLITEQQTQPEEPTEETYSFDLPDVTSITEPTLGLPFSSAAYQNQIEVTDGTDTASINITRNPKSGYTVVETVSAVDTVGSIFETRVGGAPADGSQIYYPTADSTTITASGIITTDSTGFVAFVWDVTSKEWDAVTFTTQGEGIPSIDRTTWNAVGAYLRTQGYTGGNNDVIMEWLSDQGFEGAYNDRWDGYWDSLGYTGGHNDKRTQWVKS